MNANYQWSEYNEQPGLFTLYFQDKVLVPTSRDDISQTQVQELIENYKQISQENMDQTYENPSQATFKRETAEITHQGVQFQKEQSRTQSVNPSSSSVHLNSDPESDQDVQITTKTKNFDLNRSNSKTVFYEERPVPYIRALSKKLSTLSVKNQKVNTTLTTSYNKEPEPQLDLKKSTNSDAPSKPILHNKTPFLDILLRPTPKQSSSTLHNRHKLTLSHLITFNNPAYYKQHYRIKTQR